MSNKISNSKFAYLVSTDLKTKQLLSIDDALLRVEDGISLRNHLFDVKALDDEGAYVPVKFVFPKNRTPYFATKAETTAKKGQHMEKADGLGFNLLHENAKKFIVSKNYNGIMFGKFFNIADTYITDIVVEETISFVSDDVSRLVTLRPDCIIRTPFMDFYMEITVTHGLDEAKLADYKMYYRSEKWDMPFMVVEIDLSDLQERARVMGYASVEDEVIDRILYNYSYKTVHPMLTMKLEDAPFGRSDISGKPFSLIFNTYADSISPEFRKLIKTHPIFKDLIKIQHDENEGLLSVFVTDNSAIPTKYPLLCPKHKESPIRIVMQAPASYADRMKDSPNRDNIFAKCDLHITNNSKNWASDLGLVSECEITLSLCDKNGVPESELLVAGNFKRFLNDNERIFKRVLMCRDCFRVFKKLDSLRK